jgi:hypothetical protein
MDTLLLASDLAAAEIRRASDAGVSKSKKQRLV